MGTYTALISSTLLLSTFPLSIVKFLALMWIGAVLSLLAILGIAIFARWVILPCADPALHRLISASQRRYQPLGKNYR
ncbi:MAG TPA: hypothetical protein VFY27_02320 [Woeseiaceae bacterium]|nr:hypothetical protein [Woeseiaceae bacterium]